LTPFTFFHVSCFYFPRAESHYLWQEKLKWIASTTKQVVTDGLVATLSSIAGHILALGQEASGCRQIWFQH